MKIGNAGPKFHWRLWEKSGFPALRRDLYFLTENKGHIGEIYGLCGSRNFRQFPHRVTVFTQCWSHFSIGVYGSKTVFSWPFFEYCSKVQTVSEKKVGFAPKLPSHGLYYTFKGPEHTGGPGTPFSPIGANAIWDQHCRFLSPSRDGRIDGNCETRIVHIGQKQTISCLLFVHESNIKENIAKMPFFSHRLQC